MRTHRFYVGTELELKRDFWLHDQKLIHQWKNVLRMTAGQEVVLFDGVGEDRLYKIAELSDKEAHLQLVTELQRKTPQKEIYLIWSLLKKDKNDWIIQKATELGVSHFVPITSDRCERLILSQSQHERWEKIAIEAAEQCGRSDIPAIREPMKLQTALEEFGNKVELYICEQQEDPSDVIAADTSKAYGVVIGPEGGWSDAEKQLFTDMSIRQLHLHDFTLRAETAAIAAITCINQF
jgi:16S rRNA (uracil1498-N3)-methyltransferase